MNFQSKAIVSYEFFFDVLRHFLQAKVIDCRKGDLLWVWLPDFAFFFFVYNIIHNFTALIEKLDYFFSVFDVIRFNEYWNYPVWSVCCKRVFLEYLFSNLRSNWVLIAINHSHFLRVLFIRNKILYFSIRIHFLDLLLSFMLVNICLAVDKFDWSKWHLFFLTNLSSELRHCFFRVR